MLNIYNMIFWTIRWILISLVLIILVHYLYSFFKTTLTVPKVRDLVNKPIEKYNEMLNITPQKEKPNKEEMQVELQTFLQDLKPPQQQQIIAANETQETNGVFSSY